MPPKIGKTSPYSNEYKLSRRQRLAVHIYARLPDFVRTAIGLTGGRALHFLGLDSRDFLYYEIVGPTFDDVWEAIWNERRPFRTHAQFCASVPEGQRECDCGATWHIFDINGRSVEYIGNIEDWPR